MSVFSRENISCPSCGVLVRFHIARSVNVGRSAEMRDAILSGSFQAMRCTNCDTSIRLDPFMNYLDIERGQWLLVRSHADLMDWVLLERKASSLFSDSFGEKSNKIARSIGAGLTPRLVFGWPALQEKILINEKGLDDVEVELTKIALMRHLSYIPLHQDIDLRLQRVEDGEMEFVWINTPAGEVVLETLILPLAFYDEIAADREGWQPLREQVSASYFVDAKRLMLEETPVSQVEGG